MSRGHNHTGALTRGPQPRHEEMRVTIPDGTAVELVTAHAISPGELKVGDAVSFHVARHLIIDDLVLIAAGAAAVGVVTEAAEGRGRRADITWSVKEMTTPDGAPFPVRLSFSQVCEYAEPEERETKAAALMFPVSPLALSYGSRRGSRARIPARARLRALVRGDVAVRTGRDKEED